VKLSLTGVSL